MKLKKCPECKKYTLKEKCPKCSSKTKEAHYKFLRIKSLSK
ncbi:MAG: RNA-protein complex protein Nop10 [Nanoarchaeota archaeon]|nr:RNA-protein complex protein Nop10 [Nanoarchaeota archaeon]